MMKLNKHWKAHCNLLLSASGLVLIGIAGCGGGGGGSNARTAPTLGPTNIPSGEGQPTPTPTIAPTPGGGTTPTDPTACDATTYTPNYVNGLLAGTNDPNSSPGRQRLAYWKAFAIRIYFNPDAENTAARKTLVVNGFNQWVTGTNNGTRWVETTDKSNADSVVFFTTYDPAKTGSTLGTTRTGLVPGTKQIASWYQDTLNPENARSGTMILGFQGDSKDDTLTACHEYGHLMGLGGHSPDIADVMYYTGNTSGVLTTADINTVKTAYCNNFNQTGALTARNKPLGVRIPLRIDH